MATMETSGGFLAVAGNGPAGSVRGERLQRGGPLHDRDRPHRRDHGGRRHPPTGEHHRGERRAGNASALKLRITVAGGTPTGGIVRVTVFGRTGRPSAQ